MYNYTARNTGINPYKAYRLTYDFALKEDYSLASISEITLKNNNPFEQIPAFVHKD